MKRLVKFFAALVGVLYAVSSVNPVHAAGAEDIFNHSIMRLQIQT